MGAGVHGRAGLERPALGDGRWGTWSDGTLPPRTIWGGESRFGSGFDFRSSGEGWIGAANRAPLVYQTADGGKTWTARVMPVPANALPNPISGSGRGYPSYTTEVRLLPVRGVIVYVSDSFGDTAALASFDRGASWLTLSPPTRGLQFSDYQYQDATHWSAMRYNTLFKTADAGTTWREIYPPLVEGWDYHLHAIENAGSLWALMTWSGKQGWAPGWR